MSCSQVVGVIAAILVAGCARSEAPVPAPPPAASVEAGTSSAAFVLPPLAAYVCPNGLLMEVESDAATGTLTIQYGDAGGVAFLTAGSSPPVYVHGEISMQVAEDALQVTAGTMAEMHCPRRPQAPTTGIVWGTLSKRDRAALPPGTRVRVVLEDVSRAGAPALALASADVTTVGNQVPLHFLLTYDPEQVLDRHSYSLRARVEAADGRLLYVTDTHNPVFDTGPAPAPMDLMLVPARP